MKNVLVASDSEKSAAFLNGMLSAASCGAAVIAGTGGAARRLLLDREFDLVIINAPLPDETGESLSRYAASKETAQVILIVRGEYFDEMSAAVEDAGVLVVAKPVDRNVLWSSLKLAKSAHGRLEKLRAENSKLRQAVEDMKIISRAKCALISALKMSEQEAHRFLEKQSMDMRSTRRAIAESVLRTYSA